MIPIAWRLFFAIFVSLKNQGNNAMGTSRTVPRNIIPSLTSVEPAKTGKEKYHGPATAQGWPGEKPSMGLPSQAMVSGDVSARVMKILKRYSQWSLSWLYSLFAVRCWKTSSTCRDGSLIFKLFQTRVTKSHVKLSDTGRYATIYKEDYLSINNRKSKQKLEKKEKIVENFQIHRTKIWANKFRFNLRK